MVLTVIMWSVLTVVVRWPEGVVLDSPPRRKDDKVRDGHTWFGAGAGKHREDRRVLRGRQVLIQMKKTGVNSNVEDRC